MPLETPIAFCIFNRPELTRRVFETISAAKPKTLLIIADGARPGFPGEQEQVDEARTILERIDWSCEVKKNFSDVNLGCKHRMASGLDWAFEQAEQLIILEDDCLPSPSFFPYCEQLLERYRDDERIMMISGDNFQPVQRTTSSYYYSRWSHIWGWASWRRAWKHFDIEISSWPEVKQRQQLRSVVGTRAEYEHWTKTLDLQHAGKIDTWDFPWMYACWIHSGLTIIPEKNLISNIGFGSAATHTTDPSSRLANLETSELTQLVHPTRIMANYIADQFTWDELFAKPPSLAANSQEQRTKWYHRFSRSKAA